VPPGQAFTHCWRTVVLGPVLIGLAQQVGQFTNGKRTVDTGPDRDVLLVSVVEDPSPFRPHSGPLLEQYASYMAIASLGQDQLKVLALSEDRWPAVAEFVWVKQRFDSIPPPWFVFGTVSVLSSGLGFTELRVVATGEAGTEVGLDSKAMREIPLGHLLAIITAQLQSQATMDELRSRFGVTERDDDQVQGTRRAVDSLGQRRGGRPGLGDDHYRRVATVYLEEVIIGVRGVLQRVADRLSQELGRTVPRETVRDWVSVARHDKGFLGPTKSGRAGVQPGPNLE